MNKLYKYRILLVILLIHVFFLLSCNLISDLNAGMALDARTKPFPEARIKPYAGIASRMLSLKNIASGLSWPAPALPRGVLLDSEEALGYEILYSGGGAKYKTLVAWSKKDRDARTARLAKQNIPYTVNLLFHCRPYLDKASPLPEAALKWTDARLGEWLAWEWAAKAIGTKNARKLSAVSYVAWKFNEAVITKQQGPGAPELAAWKEAVRDRHTFQVLVSDIRSQVQGILDANPDSADRKKTLQRIERNWLNVFRQEYENRFLTNQYTDFGKSGWVEPLSLFQIDQDTLGWKEWEAETPESVNNAQELLDMVRD